MQQPQEATMATGSQTRPVPSVQTHRCIFSGAPSRARIRKTRTARAHWRHRRACQPCDRQRVAADVVERQAAAGAKRCKGERGGTMKVIVLKLVPCEKEADDLTPAATSGQQAKRLFLPPRLPPPIISCFTTSCLKVLKKKKN